MTFSKALAFLALAAFAIQVSAVSFAPVLSSAAEGTGNIFMVKKANNPNIDGQKFGIALDNRAAPLTFFSAQIYDTEGNPVDIVFANRGYFAVFFYTSASQNNYITAYGISADSFPMNQAPDQIAYLINVYVDSDADNLCVYRDQVFSANGTDMSASVRNFNPADCPMMMEDPTIEIQDYVGDDKVWKIGNQVPGNVTWEVQEGSGDTVKIELMLRLNDGDLFKSVLTLVDSAPNTGFFDFAAAQIDLPPFLVNSTSYAVVIVDRDDDTRYGTSNPLSVGICGNVGTGDVDGGGSMNIVDVVSLLQVLVMQTETDAPAGCTFAEVVNGDEDPDINIVDAVYWLQEILNTVDSASTP